jgi:orotidine-5'-phosphate decarboxylase
MERRAEDKIIIALDVETLEQAQGLVALLKNSSAMFKVGKQMFTRYGPEMITMIHEQGGTVFLDLKFHDIPNTVAKAAEEVVRHGVCMFNVHAMGGFEMMKQTVEAVRMKAATLHTKPPRILAVTVLTSLGGSDLALVGITAPIQDQVLRLAQLARTAGIDGVVASPQEIEIIKRECGQDFLVITPGVRPKEAASNDQKRTLTPGEALKRGADYIVIGRPVTQASDPLRALKKIIGEIEG